MTDQATAALTHLRADGSAHMVDVTAKPETARRAVAQAVVVTRADVVDRVIAGGLPKGEALGTARIAGIMAAKQTSTLIPLCHPLPLSAISVDIASDRDAGRLVVTATVSTTATTGVEMEALTAASVAALTLYDMIKAVDRLASITDIFVTGKQGGKSGDWVRP